ncbi:hypothetical protein MD484_g3775, partial [Candolleomyces efflorescens]
MGAQGFLAVFSDPGSNATLAEFQDWYDNEHVPLRLNHLPSFLSGARYAAVDAQPQLPGWLAMYEIDDIASFRDPKYTVLREQRSERERELIGRLGVLDRRTAEVVVDTGERSERSTGMRVGNPSKFVLTVGVDPGEDIEGKLGELGRKLGTLPGWVRTRIVRVFDKGVTGLNDKWTKIHIPDYLAVVELTSKLQQEDWESVVVDELRLLDKRQWGIYNAYPCIAQGNLPA